MDRFSVLCVQVALHEKPFCLQPDERQRRFKFVRGFGCKTSYLMK